MHQNLALFGTAADMAAHASQRINQTAINIANADTPGYRAQTIGGFAEAYAGALTGSALRQTRAHHLAGDGLAPTNIQRAAVEESPNGNSVSLELETLAAIDAQREHNQALSIYRHGLTMLRTAIGG
ncbi:flagellar basal body protein [Ketogulonicigenium vulgare]|uniref:flagellar basal body protein n=1 Tax=Ketogulonicigenium vulgare TaxID=92945 RepID=UPI002358E617|nr:flagellar basal body protein [Ketogulonicigenium vulgare]